MSTQARRDAVGVEDERPGSKGWGGRRALGLEVEDERPGSKGHGEGGRCVRARIDTVRARDEHLGPKGHGRGGRRAVAPKLTRWEWEASNRALEDTVEVVDEQLCSN